MTGLERARALLEACRKFDGSYDYGGGHGPALSVLSPHQGLDCSSSVSLALWERGLMGDPRTKGQKRNEKVAQVSGWFEEYGRAGPGMYVTVHANAEHVWLEFTLPDGWFRFDTSPHGDGGRGPRVRTGKRPTSNFVVRHPPGL